METASIYLAFIPAYNRALQGSIWIVESHLPNYKLRHLFLRVVNGYIRAVIQNNKQTNSSYARCSMEVYAKMELIPQFYMKNLGNEWSLIRNPENCVVSDSVSVLCSISGWRHRHLFPHHHQREKTPTHPSQCESSFPSISPVKLTSANSDLPRFRPRPGIRLSRILPPKSFSGRAPPRSPSQVRRAKSAYRHRHQPGNSAAAAWNTNLSFSG
ncbi:hypothetical protein HDV63DRAFT_378227 [Trichoderma sp. SZMC 28014]